MCGCTGAMSFESKASAENKKASEGSHTSHVTMAGLSSNVMNMKFMQNAKDKKKGEEQQPEVKKVKDVSEWLLPNGSIKHKLKPAVTIRTVGYGSIASLTANEKESESGEENPQPKLNTETEKLVCSPHSPRTRALCVALSCLLHQY